MTLHLRAETGFISGELKFAFTFINKCYLILCDETLKTFSNCKLHVISSRSRNLKKNFQYTSGSQKIANSIKALSGKKFF